MGRKLKADEVAVLAREVERLSEKERNLLEREKRVKDWENAAHVRNSGEPARPKGDSRAQNLWKKAREGMKPATLSEKLRNAEKAIAILAARLENAGLSTDVDGEECSDNKEIAKLREENEALAMKLQLANGRSAGSEPAMKAAAAADKRARDLKAKLAALKAQYQKQKSELELSCQAGIRAREEVQRLKAELQQQGRAAQEMSSKGAEKERAKQELQEIAEKIKNLELEKKSLHERLKGAETDSARLRVELEEQRSRLKQLANQRKNMTSKKELQKLDSNYKQEKEKVKELSDKLQAAQSLMDRLNEMAEKLKRKEERLLEEKAEKEKLMLALKRKAEEVKGLEASLKSAELEKETMRAATKSAADAASVSISSVEQVVNSLRNDLEELRGENGSLNQSMRKVRNENVQLQDKINDLELASKDQQDFNDASLQLHGMVQSLKKDVKALTEKLEQQEKESKNIQDGLAREVEEAKQASGELKASNKTLEKQLMENTIEMDELKAANEGLKEETVRLQNVLKDKDESMSSNSSDLHGKVEQLLKKNEALEKELHHKTQELQDSESAWGTIKQDIQHVEEQLKLEKKSSRKQRGLVEKHEGEVKKLQQSGEKDKKQICKLKEDLTKASKKISENNSEFRNTLDEQAAGHRRAEEEMRKDIELLSGQLSSLIENGEEYKKNVNRREVQFKKQIEELQSARKSDIKNFSKVRKAATAWQKKVAGTNTSKSTKQKQKPSTAGSPRGNMAPRSSLRTLPSLHEKQVAPAGPKRELSKRAMQYVPRTPPRSSQSVGGKPRNSNCPS